MDFAPLDSYDQTLVDRVAPRDWTNPVPPTEGYNLVAVGGGTAGLVSAMLTAGLGGRAALVERRLLGGDCLNFGCVPSKALLRAARAAADVVRFAQFGGTSCGEGKVDFNAVMQRMRRLRAEISRNDAAARVRLAGVDVYRGEATFDGAASLCVDGQRLRFHRAIIATGTRPAVPAVEGLAEAGFLTNESIFSLTELPRRLLVIGGGPIGCELAQAFRRFGSEVHLIHRHERLLTKGEPEASELLGRQLRREGIVLHLGWSVEQVDGHRGAKSLLIGRREQKKKIIGDTILVATGRAPNVESLGLDAAGVRYDARGVVVDDRLRTSNPRIFAAGDICGKWKFTHAADAMARLAVQNALFHGRQRASQLVIPRTTYTDPEVAHVGLTIEAAQREGIPIDTYYIPLAEVDRAVLDGEPEGFAQVHTKRGKGTVVGGTIVARHAGEMIGELCLLMTARQSLGMLSRTVHCYPTQVESLRRLGDQYQRTRLTPSLARWLARWLAWQRGKPPVGRVAEQQARGNRLEMSQVEAADV